MKSKLDEAMDVITGSRYQVCDKTITIKGSVGIEDQSVIGSSAMQYMPLYMPIPAEDEIAQILSAEMAKAIDEEIVRTFSVQREYYTTSASGVDMVFDMDSGLYFRADPNETINTFTTAYQDALGHLDHRVYLK